MDGFYAESTIYGAARANPTYLLKRKLRPEASHGHPRRRFNKSHSLRAVLLVAIATSNSVFDARGSQIIRVLLFVVAREPQRVPIYGVFNNPSADSVCVLSKFSCSQCLSESRLFR